MRISALLRESDGFTLAELMVVIAIVGLLAAIANVQYLHFAARARESEAKLELSGIYTAEVSFNVEWNSYTACLNQAGFAPDVAKRYYYIGFSMDPRLNPSAGVSSCNGFACDYYSFVGAGQKCNDGPSGTIPLGAPLSYSDVVYAATVQVVPQASWTGAINPATTTNVSGNTFSAVAAGSIYSSTPDIWTIDQSKILSHVQSGE